MADEAVSLDFNPSDFLRGLQEITQKWSEMNNTMSQTEKSAQSVNKVGTAAQNTGQQGAKMGGLMTASWGKLLAIGGLLVGAFQSMKGALMNMPEIGMTFQVAGDIFMRNFLQPLRQELFPILQNILNWVRDNRAQFVKWGSVVLEVFRVAFMAAKTLFNLVSGAFTQFADTMKGVFGQSAMSIENIIRVVITKVAAIIAFAEILFMPLFEALGRLVGVVVAGIIGFFRGVFSAAEPVIGIIVDIVSEITRLIDIFGKGEGKASAFMQIMEMIGQVVGTFIVVAVQRVATAIKYAVNFIEGFVEGFREIGEQIGLFAAFEKFQQVLIKIGQALQKLFGPSTAIGKVFKFLGQVVGGALALAFRGVLEILTGVGDVIVWIIEQVSSLAEWFGEKLSGAIGGISKHGKGLMGIINALGRVMKNFSSWIGRNISQPLSDMANKLGSIATSISNFFKSVFDGLKKFITDSIGWVEDKVKAVQGWLPSWAGGQDDDENMPTPTPAQPAVSPTMAGSNQTNNVTQNITVQTNNPQVAQGVINNNARNAIPNQGKIRLNRSRQAAGKVN